VSLLALEEIRDEPRALLARLLCFGSELCLDELETRFPSLDVDGLVDLGVLSVAEGRVVSLVEIWGVDGLFLMSDPLEVAWEPVAPVSRSTWMAVVLTPRVPVGSALDLGCGCGVQALLAARHASEVIATDVNSRALQLTELNAVLNGVDNVETRVGSFFDAASEERFDLVVANLPHVVSPDPQIAYQDSPLDGDRLSREILELLPAHLLEHGFGLVQGSWIHSTQTPWWTPLVHCLRDRGCDAMLVRIDTSSPLSYAITFVDEQDPERFVAAVRRRRDSYRDAGIEAITVAVAIVRRRTGRRNWFTAVTMRDLVTRPFGEKLAGLFDTHDTLFALPDEDALLDMRVRRAPGLTLTHISPLASSNHRSVERDGGSDRYVLSCATALGSRRTIRPEIAQLVRELDDGLALRSSQLGRTSPTSDIRALIELGFLELT
jgi:SAM-dependent methyltransferase